MRTLLAVVLGVFVLSAGGATALSALVVERGHQGPAGPRGPQGLRVAFGLYALAVYLPHGRRRETLRSVGYGFIAAGAVAWIARGMAGTAVVNALAKNESVRPAAEAVWSIGTSLLVEAAASCITFGVLLVIAAVFAGPTRHAVRLRGWAAPYLRDRPGVTYAAVGAIYLALIAWAPIAAFRKPLGILVFALLMVLGTEVLKRQTTREFPEAATPEALEEHRRYVRERDARREARRAEQEGR
jgi:hypothetical protein